MSKSFLWNALQGTAPHISCRYVRCDPSRKNSHWIDTFRRLCNNDPASLPFVRITAFLPFLCLRRSLDEIAGDKAVICIDRNWLLAHTDDTAVATVQGRLINHAVFLNFTAVGCGALFNLQWMNDIVFLHKDINLFCVGIPKIRDIHLGFCVGS